MMDLNLVSLVQQGNQKARRINVLILVLTLLLLVILNYQKHGVKQQKETIKIIPVTSSLTSDLNKARVAKKVTADTQPDIEDCILARRDLKLIGAVLDDVSTVVLFKQVSSEKIVTFIEDVKLSRAKESAEFYQEPTWDLLLNWKGCEINFSI